MWIRALCFASIIATGCAPKQVESPLEKAPPPEIATARELGAAGDARGAKSAYEKFIVEHPGTAEADLARLELGLLLADTGRCQDALLHFEQAEAGPDPALALRAALHRGACQLTLGDPERALQTLQPLAAERFAAEEQALLWDTVVIAAEQTTNAALALQALDALASGGSDPPDPQRVWETSLLLSQKVTLEEAATLSEGLNPSAAPRTALSMRLLEHALETQDAERVKSAADALRTSAWMAVPEVTMLVARADEFLHGNPFAVGVLLPLSGRGREVGRQLLQGMQLAQLDEGGPELVVRDTGGDPRKTIDAVDALVGSAGVVGILGPVSSRTTEAAADASRRAGVPLITFSASEEVTSASDRVFRMLYSPRDELSALVRKARDRGLSRFIILYPDHGYGRAMERLFDQEVSAAGGVACEGVPYPAGTKSFVDYVRVVLETSCDVVLLADAADHVVVVAPTFAAEGAWSIAGGRLPDHAERRVHFLLPSVSWSPALLQRTGRYLQGALITLPYYGPSEDPANERFRTAYETRYGRPPQTFAAYGYDAYRLLSSTLRQGHQSRESLANALMGGSAIAPVTSTGALSAARTPADRPRVYRIVDQGLEVTD